MQEPTEDATVACSLSAGEMDEQAEDFADLLTRVRAVDETRDGFDLTFPSSAETLRRVLDWVLAERRCCPHFRFELVLEPGLGPARLRLRGPREAKEIIRPFLGIAGRESGQL